MARYSATPGDISNLYTAGNVVFDSRALGQMLYQEQKVREQRAAQEDAQVAKMLQEDVGKVRSADVGLVTDMYGRAKEAKMNLMNPKIKSNPQLYALAQHAHQKAMNDYYTTVRGSVEEKEKDKILSTLGVNDRNDEYGGLMAARMKTPLNQLQQFQLNGRLIDLSNPDSFRDLNTYYDSHADFEAARGKQGQFAWNKGKRDSLTDTVETYEFNENNPEQSRNILLRKWMGNKNGRKWALNEAANLDPAEYKRVDDAFNALPATYWQSQGRSKPQMTPVDMNNPFDVVADYNAKKIALENQPRLVKTDYPVNEERERAAKIADEKSMELFKSGLRKDEDRLKEQMKGKSDGEKVSALGAHIDRMVEDARKTSKKALTIGGKTVQVNHIPVTPSLAKTLEVVDTYGNKRTPNMIGVDDNGEFYGIFYKPEINKESNSYTGKFEKTPSGNYKIEGVLTSRIPRPVLQAEFANQLLTPKAVEGSLSEPTGAAMPSAPKKPAVPKKVESLRNKYGY